MNLPDTSIFIILPVEPSFTNCYFKGFDAVSSKPSPFNLKLIPDRASEGISTVCPKRLVKECKEAENRQGNSIQRKSFQHMKILN